MNGMKANWNTYLKERNNKAVLFISIAALALTLFGFMHFLTYNEARHGFSFADPVLRLLPPVNISLLTFVLTYATCIFGIITAMYEPRIFILLVQAYTLMTLLRMLTLFLVPLDPPQGIIPLKDLFLQFSFYSGRDNLRDLFFSGHTTALFLFAFAFEKKWLKILFTTVGCIVGFLLMWQHVHYSVDVVVAPVVAFVMVFICQKLEVKSQKKFY